MGREATAFRLFSTLLCFAVLNTVRSPFDAGWDVHHSRLENHQALDDVSSAQRGASRSPSD